jgi:hypothetical protein
MQGLARGSARLPDTLTERLTRRPCGFGVAERWFEGLESTRDEPTMRKESEIALSQTSSLVSLWPPKKETTVVICTSVRMCPFI